MGNVFDQNETYDCAVRGALAGLPAPAPEDEPEAVAPEPAPEPDEDGEILAACATMAALLTIELAADRALARFGRPPPDGAKTAARGFEAAAETTLEAKFELEPVLTGRVCM